MKTFMQFLALALLVVVAGCDASSQPAVKYKYEVGEVVRLKLDNEKVQVIRRWSYSAGTFYECRVGGLHQSRRDGLLSADTEIVRYQEITFREYELVPDVEDEP